MLHAVARSAKDDHAKGVPREVLLELEVLVGGDQDVDPEHLSPSQERTVIESFEAELSDGLDGGQVELARELDR